MNHPYIGLYTHYTERDQTPGPSPLLAACRERVALAAIALARRGTGLAQPFYDYKIHNVILANHKITLLQVIPTMAFNSSHLTFCLANLLAFYLAFCLRFYLAYLLAFYLSYLLTFYLEYLLAFHLACLLTFYLAYLR